MKVSLVTGTIGRAGALHRLLQSLRKQTFQNYELIIVDQNDDNRIGRILELFQDALQIRHAQLDEKGLSRARNCGLKYAQGDIIAFPDDDCWYAEETLGRVVELFKENPSWDGLTGKSIDGTGNSSSGRWDERKGVINKQNVWRRAISYTIFLRKRVVEEVGTFDEKLGVGSQTDLGSGEETDYLLRALDKGYRLWYEPELTVYHPSKTNSWDEDSVERAYSYGTGMGYLMQKHDYSALFFTYYAIRSIGGVLWGLMKREPMIIRYYWAVLAGRTRGYMEKPASLRENHKP